MRRLAAALLTGALLTTIGCLTGRRSEPLVGPPALEGEAERRGQLVFMEYCNQCHPGGDGGLGPALNNKPAPGAAIKLQVRQGLGRMPAFSEQVIDDGALDALVAYLKAIRRND